VQAGGALCQDSEVELNSRRGYVETSQFRQACFRKASKYSRKAKYKEEVENQ